MINKMNIMIIFIYIGFFNSFCFMVVNLILLFEFIEYFFFRGREENGEDINLILIYICRIMLVVVCIYIY